MNGPIDRANNTVPTPKVPPSNHPQKTTVNSILFRTTDMGKLVTFCNPVIRPSLGPGPKFAIRYIALPSPIRMIPIIA